MFPAALLKALLSPQGLHRAGRCLPLRCSGKSAWPGAHQCHRGEDRTVWPQSLLALLQKTSVTGRGHGAFSSPPMAAQEPGDGRASCLCTPRHRELCSLAALTQAPELRQPQNCCSAPWGMHGGTAAHPSAAPPALRCPQARRRPRAGAVPSPGAVQGGTGCVCLLQGTARLCRGGMAAAASLSLADPVPSWQQGRGVSCRSRPSCGCRRSPRQVQGRRRTWGCLCPVPML